MQLRKVCNHPNLFEPRPTISPFVDDGLDFAFPSNFNTINNYDPFKINILDNCSVSTFYKKEDSIPYSSTQMFNTYHYHQSQIRVKLKDYKEFHTFLMKSRVSPNYQLNIKPVIVFDKESLENKKIPDNIKLNSIKKIIDDDSK